MNYVKEINAFYDQLVINPLSSSAIALWYALMHINNKTGWQREFSVAVSVLSIKSGLKERTVYLARNELMQKGYISFRSRRGNQSAAYVLYSLSAHGAGNHVDNHVGSHVDSGVSSSVDNGAALIKLNKTKPNNNKQEDQPNPHLFYEQNGFGLLSPVVIEDINHWLDNAYFAEPEKIIVEAMRLAVLNNARNWQYVSRILIDWHARQFKTLADVQAHQAEWQNRKSNVAKFKPRRKGSVPDDPHQGDARPDYSQYDFRF